MWFESSPVHVLFLFIIIHATCQQEDLITFNATSARHTNATESPVPTAVTTASTPFWCPDGYILLAMHRKWVRVCRPLSCPGSNSTSSKKCSIPSKTLRTCQKAYLNQDQYAFDSNGSLLNLHHNSSVALGNYVVEATRAIVCAPQLNGSSMVPSKPVELPSWCMPIDVPKGHYNYSAGRLYVSNIRAYVELFTIARDETAHACPRMDPVATEKCGKSQGVLPGDDIEVLPNWSLRHNANILHQRIYLLGTYILAEDKSFAQICVVPMPHHYQVALRVKSTAIVISAVCLLLTLLAHWLHPSLNKHPRVLLCLVFSFLIMYVTMAVRYFSNNFKSEAANMALFAFQYIFSLAAFFWLNIMAFDLWRGLAVMRQAVNRKRASNKHFFAKCVYAWGIPIFLCIFIMALTFSPNAQHRLGLKLRLQKINWLHDTKTIIILFYTPIIIVLLENIIFFILTIANLLKASRGIKIVNKAVNKTLFRAYVKLFLVMGLCWLAEVLSMFLKHETNSVAWHATDVINALQGVFIFLVYVCKKETLRIFKQKLGSQDPSQIKAKFRGFNPRQRSKNISHINAKFVQTKQNEICQK